MHLPTLLCCATFLSLACASAPARSVHHYTFFGQDRESLRQDSAFISTTRLEGAQVSYSWRQLEPAKDEYDFSIVREDLAFLTSKGKRLFIQLQDVTSSPTRINVPRYLLEDPRYNGGAEALCAPLISMRTLAKIALGTLLVLVGLVLFIAKRWDELSALCGNEVLGTALASGGRTRAVLFRRNCGATTGFSTQVSVLPSTDSLPNEPGNVFVISEDRGQASPPRGAGPVLKLRWLDARRLQIRYDAGWRVPVADTLVDGIKVRYVKTAPAAPL